MMECESGNQRKEHNRTHPGCTNCMFSIVLLLSILVSVGSPYLTWAAVYECLDVAGKPTLTNRPAQPQNCRMLIEETTPNLTPDVSTPPQVAAPPSPYSYVPNDPPLPSNLPSDHATSPDSFSASNPGKQSLPSPPCAHRLNPLNPLSTPPCVRSGQSEAQSQPEAAPTPSP